MQKIKLAILPMVLALMTIGCSEEINNEELLSYLNGTYVDFAEIDYQLELYYEEYEAAYTNDDLELMNEINLNKLEPTTEEIIVLLKGVSSENEEVMKLNELLNAEVNYKYQAIKIEQDAFELLLDGDEDTNNEAIPLISQRDYYYQLAYAEMMTALTMLDDLLAKYNIELSYDE